MQLLLDMQQAGGNTGDQPFDKAWERRDLPRPGGRCVHTGLHRTG